MSHARVSFTLGCCFLTGAWEGPLRRNPIVSIGLLCRTHGLVALRFVIPTSVRQILAGGPGRYVYGISHVSMWMNLKIAACFPKKKKASSFSETASSKAALMPGRAAWHPQEYQKMIQLLGFLVVLSSNWKASTAHVVPLWPKHLYPNVSPCLLGPSQDQTNGYDKNHPQCWGKCLVFRAMQITA